MRIIDSDRKAQAHQIQLYLSGAEAEELREHLDALLGDPEANEHRHVMSRDGGAELSLSIVTPAKIESGRYTTLEAKVLRGKW